MDAWLLFPKYTTQRNSRSGIQYYVGIYGILCNEKYSMQAFLLERIEINDLQNFKQTY